MDYLSVGDAKAIKAKAIAGQPITSAQVLAMLEEIDRLAELVRDMQMDHAVRSLVDRRREPREAVMSQVMVNLEGLTEVVALTKKEGA
jgi:hypothetical protein